MKEEEEEPEEEPVEEEVAVEEVPAELLQILLIWVATKLSPKPIEFSQWNQQSKSAHTSRDHDFDLIKFYKIS